MSMRRILTLVAFVVTSATGYVSASAQGTQPQIPTLQVCNRTQAGGTGTVKVDSRADATHSGKFDVSIELKCDSINQYPTGNLKIADISMSDSIVQGTITSIGFEQVTSTGKHTPTLFLNGRCKAANITGCRFWLMIADNKTAAASGTPDVVSFLVFDGTGKRVAYGTGPVVQGDLDVKDTGN
jgi:hypothetical protein